MYVYQLFLVILNFKKAENHPKMISSFLLVPYS
ncbi:hypothetical protein LMOSLCC2479_0875 [Listeria monocytogenes SLCC2479]|nr:hypothetical protein LM5578_0945 [Listeria monocytogenes 08-5578]ADB70743.1 hypothetical protein LM5923_0899 [Listeria monocytogenes 08-5923]ASG96390.1 hypothetical protein N883_0910 [Listeria monocytogenes serotype 1/2a str. 01-5252]ASH83993.1 hypothetical protein N882_0909 [Listeria monocytogenes serotype 1/2a str. 01-1468]EAL07673.1 hypothetical protein LMOf6854_0911 [Listeria monocytogenes str. 1/2a F6854] [Listeria monocytogenes serotype 1/2a str. F6854]CBY54212.1 hypothetical protein 